MMDDCVSRHRFNVDGLGTNVNFLMELAAHPAFAAGDVDTDFIPRHRDELFPTKEASERQVGMTVTVFNWESKWFIFRHHPSSVRSQPISLA